MARRSGTDTTTAGEALSRHDDDGEEDEIDEEDDEFHDAVEAPERLETWGEFEVIDED